MRATIQKVIAKIPVDHIFDSHYVINCLIENHSDDYLNFASEISAQSNKTIAVHGKIAQEIAKLEVDGIIERVVSMSWSRNIHGSDSPCASWRKVSAFNDA